MSGGGPTIFTRGKEKKSPFSVKKVKRRPHLLRGKEFSLDKGEKGKKDLVPERVYPP